MRYLRLLILVILVILSHKLIYQKMDVNLTTHISIQEDLTIILAEIIQAAVPTAKDINFQYIKSKALNENSVESNFSCSFINPDQPNPVKIILEGKAILSRVFENGKATGNWTVDNFTLGDQDIEFQQDLVIQADILNTNTNDTTKKLDPTQVAPQPESSPHQ
jgi:hypothetical protein